MQHSDIISEAEAGWRRSELPGLGHEHDEVVVVVDGGGDSGVVIVPLSSSDLSVIVLVSEVGKELQEGLVLGDLARDDLWMSVTGVADSEVGGGNTARSIGVEFGESGINNSLSGGIEGTSDHDKELIKVDIAILVGVIGGEEEVSLGLGKVASALVEANEELLSINLSVSIVVNGSENSTESSDSSGTSRSHLGLDFSND